MSLKGKCYLGVVRGDKQAMKRRLVVLPGVYRVTDHGPHIKVNTTKPLPPIRGLRVILVKDRTTHHDAKLWDFPTAAFKHAASDPQALGILIHYLCNLFGEAEREAEYYAKLAANRAYLNRTVTDDQAHGWEIVALRKAGLL